MEGIIRDIRRECLADALLKFVTSHTFVVILNYPIWPVSADIHLCSTCVRKRQLMLLTFGRNRSRMDKTGRLSDTGVLLRRNIGQYRLPAVS